MTFQVLGLDHVVLRVRDIEPALGFYRDVLGCSLERSLEDMGLYQLRAGRSLIDLVPVESELGRMGGAPPGSDGRNVDHIALRIDVTRARRSRSTISCATSTAAGGSSTCFSTARSAKLPLSARNTTAS